MAPPSLVALTGPLRGKSFGLPAEESGPRVAIGRHPSNDVRSRLCWRSPPPAGQCAIRRRWPAGLLELVLAEIPAERGAVLLPDGEEDGFRAVHHKAPFQVSRTLARRVLEERTALLWNGPQGDAPPAESVTGARSRAAFRKASCRRI